VTVVTMVAMVTIHEARSTSMDKRSMDKRRPEGDGPAGFITVASPLKGELLRVITAWGEPSDEDEDEDEDEDAGEASRNKSDIGPGEGRGEAKGDPRGRARGEGGDEAERG
jgi:hypothetical protein